MMKILPLKTLAVAALFFTSFAQADTDEDCRKIAESYDEINAITEDTESIGCSHAIPREEGSWSDVSAWYDEKGVVIKVVLQRGDSHGSIATEYYLHEGELNFVFERADSTAMMEGAPTIIREKRFYFKDKKLIRKLAREKSFKPEEDMDMEDVKQITKEPKGADYDKWNAWCKKSAASLSKMKEVASESPDAVGDEEDAGEKPKPEAKE